MTWMYTMSIFLGFAGFFIAFYIRHKKTRKEHLVCPLKSNCSDVIESDFSRFFGVPVEVLGIFYYALIALGYGARLVWPEAVFLAYILLPATAVAFLFSLYLTFIQAFAIRKLCTWCLASAAICTTLIVFAFASSWDVALPLLVAYHAPIVIVHLLGMALGLGAAAMSDLFFFKFLKDFRISEFEASVLRTFSEVIWFALGVVIVSGAALFLPESERLLDSSKFIMKMIVVGVIIVNGALLNLLIAPKLIHISFKEPHDHHAGELHRSRRLAFVLGPVSILSWLWAFVLGGLHDVSLSVDELLLFYFATILVGIFAGSLFDRMLVRRASRVS